MELVKVYILIFTNLFGHTYIGVTSALSGCLVMMQGQDTRGMLQPGPMVTKKTGRAKRKGKSFSKTHKWLSVKVKPTQSVRKS